MHLSSRRCRVGCHTYTLLANREAHESECAWSRSRISHLEQKLVRAEEQLVQARLALELQRADAQAAAQAQSQAGVAGEGQEQQQEEGERAAAQQSPPKRQRGARTPEVLELDSSDENGPGEGLRAGAKGRAATGGGRGGAGKKAAASGVNGRAAGVLTQQPPSSSNRGPGTRFRLK